MMLSLPLGESAKRLNTTQFETLDFDASSASCCLPSTVPEFVSALAQGQMTKANTSDRMRFNVFFIYIIEAGLRACASRLMVCKKAIRLQRERDRSHPPRQGASGRPGLKGMTKAGTADRPDPTIPDHFRQPGFLEGRWGGQATGVTPWPPGATATLYPKARLAEEPFGQLAG